MSYREIIEKIKPEFQKTLSFLEEELGKIRTSRVSPSLIENIPVEFFGKRYLLKQLASISVIDSRQLMVQPWDHSYLEAIEKAIIQAGISGTPVVEKDIIRVSFPPLSGEFRANLIKKVHQLTESANQTIRRWRQKAWDEIQEKTREGLIREDDKFRAKDELQKMVDDYQEKFKNLAQRKEKEISQ
jgi:ribosome recycling factor